MSNSQTLTDSASDAADKLSSSARTTIDKLDSSRAALADGIDKTADVVRSLAPGAVARHAHSAAEAMENAARYIRSRDIRAIGSDLTETVRRNPTPSLITAVAVGFLLGMNMRRR